MKSLLSSFLALSLMCTLPAPSPAAAQTPAGETEEARQARIEAALQKDGLGPLHLGQPGADVIKALGQPAKRGKSVLQGADGMLVQDWSYPAKGLTLTMSAEPESKTKQTLAIIRADAKCTLATQRGIKAGSTRAEVEKAYADLKDSEESGDADTFVAGSIYGGIIFTFEKGKVVSLFLGAAAE